MQEKKITNLKNLKLKNFDPSRRSQLSDFVRLNMRKHMRPYAIEVYFIPDVDHFLSRHLSKKVVQHYGGNRLQVEGVEYGALIKHLQFSKPCIWRLIKPNLKPMYYRKKQPFLTAIQLINTLWEIKKVLRNKPLSKKQISRLADKINKRLRNYNEY